MPIFVTALARNKFRPAAFLSDEVRKGCHPVTGEKTHKKAVPIDVFAGRYYPDEADIWWTFPYERADAAPERDGTHA